MAHADAVDTVSIDANTLAVTRSQAGRTTVRVSANLGGTWHTVPSPCKSVAAAPLFALVDYKFGRFICADGTVEASWFDGKRQPQHDGDFALASTTGSAVVARSVATNRIGTVVSYTGAGLWQFVANIKTQRVAAGDFGYVGLTSVVSGNRPPRDAWQHLLGHDQRWPELDRQVLGLTSLPGS